MTKRMLPLLAALLLAALGIWLWRIQTEREQAAASSAAGRVRLWSSDIAAQGTLTPEQVAAAKAAGVQTQTKSGAIAAGSVISLASLSQGSEVLIPLPGGGELPGVVNLVLKEPDGTVRVGGSLTGPRGARFPWRPKGLNWPVRS